jgi:predicted O-linked N-acetylglucosamine transferase (SPINDLY family)
VAAGLLEIAGLSGLITDGLADYQERAVALAADPKWRQAIRKRVEAARTSRLFDMARYVTHLEDAYRAMWTASRGARSPAPITVEARP